MTSPDVPLHIKLGLIKVFVKTIAKCNSSGLDLTSCVASLLIVGKLYLKEGIL